jgi:heme/copper-type cytochrome/quinol oxidase subunit 3
MRPIATTRSAAGIPTGRLAVWWVVASEVVIFGGILASWIGAFNTLVLLSSSLSAVLAHQAAVEGNGKKASQLLWATIGGATTFLVVKGFEWTMEIQHGYTITSSTFWSFYYTAAGLHALHVLAGAIIMIFVAADAKKNLELHRVELIGIYWHFVDIVWIFLFPLLYIAK